MNREQVNALNRVLAHYGHDEIDLDDQARAVGDEQVPRCQGQAPTQ